MSIASQLHSVISRTPLSFSNEIVENAGADILNRLSHVRLYAGYMTSEELPYQRRRLQGKRHRGVTNNDNLTNVSRVSCSLHLEALRSLKQGLKLRCLFIFWLNEAVLPLVQQRLTLLSAVLFDF